MAPDRLGHPTRLQCQAPSSGALRGWLVEISQLEHHLLTVAHAVLLPSIVGAGYLYPRNSSSSIFFPSRVPSQHESLPRPRLLMASLFAFPSICSGITAHLAALASWLRLKDNRRNIFEHTELTFLYHVSLACKLLNMSHCNPSECLEQSRQHATQLCVVHCKTPQN